MFDDSYSPSHAAGVDGMDLHASLGNEFWTSENAPPPPDLSSPLPPPQHDAFAASAAAADAQLQQQQMQMMQQQLQQQQAMMQQQQQHMQQQQQQQQQDPSLYYDPALSSHPIQRGGGGATRQSAPPAHLFAAQFSPFQNAQFEVEGDLNGVNPSLNTMQPPPQAYSKNQLWAAKREADMRASLAQGRMQAQQQQMQYNGLASLGSPQRGLTSDSLGLGAAPYPSSSPIGLLPAEQMESVNVYDSMIDRVEEQAQGSRKRARGAAGAPLPPSLPMPSGSAAAQSALHIDLSGELEERDLGASTFQVYPPGEAPSTRLVNPTLSVAPPSLSHRPPSSSARSHASNDRGNTSPTETDDPHAPVETKKVKHQLTDRQRRAKIKESMDALKALVPLDASQKADQATIVASSVTLVKDLKDEVRELKEKLQAMELREAQESLKYDTRKSQMQGAVVRGHHQPQLQQQIPLSNSPFTSMMASLNGAGVAMWRLGLTGAILEVNLVFELVSGFSAREVIGSTPCHPPMYGSLSIMPSAFLKAFSQVSAVPQINSQQQQQQQAPLTSGASSSSGSGSSVSSPQLPHSPLSSVGSNDATTPLSPHAAAILRGDQPYVKLEVGENNISVNQSSTAQGQGSASQTSVAPLYANASISNFPIVPQAQLQNFFPYKCRSLIDAAPHAGVVQPQPHGNFLVNHLAALPSNHVLKLLCRHHTLWGEILESIVTLCLVRDHKGDPDYIMILSTPDCRRLLTPATHSTSHMMGGGLKTPASAGSDSGAASMPLPSGPSDMDQACLNSGEMNLTGY